MNCPSKGWPGNAFAATNLINRFTISLWPHKSRPSLCHERPNDDGGCDFAARPGLSAVDQPVFWSPSADPAILIITRRPELLPPASSPSQPDVGTARDSPDGRHAIDAAGQTGFVLLPGAGATAPIAALIPFDEYTLDRIEAATRAWRAWSGRAVPRDTRLTPDQRRRLRLKLQAADGRRNGASYREIAAAIFGEARVAAEPWKTSSLRDTVIELVEGGFDLIAGGYRKLLRHRRRS